MDWSSYEFRKEKRSNKQCSAYWCESKNTYEFMVSKKGVCGDRVSFMHFCSKHDPIRMFQEWDSLDDRQRELERRLKEM